MPYATTAIGDDGVDHSVGLDKYPDECPICHIAIYPKFLGLSTFNRSPTTVQTIFRCTRNACGKLFVATYTQLSGNSFGLSTVEPIYPKPQEFPPEIEAASPTFVQVYNQAIAAESGQLDQLSGIGLRKALEFLIKDFAISQNPKDEEKIKKMLQNLGLH